MKRSHILAAVLVELAVAASLFGGDLKPQRLLAEYRIDPLGLEAARPRLSWTCTAVDPAKRGLRQTAYQLVVAGSAAGLDGQKPLWDSGKVESEACVYVEYAGPALASHQQCFWKVRVWDQAGQPSDWSAAGHWSMGALTPADFAGQWLRYVEPVATASADNAPQPTLEGTSWIWYPGAEPLDKTLAGNVYFRRAVELPAGVKIRKATLAITADDHFALYVNGQLAGSSRGTDAWRQGQAIDVAALLVSGRNVLAVATDNSIAGPAGLAAKLEITAEDGKITREITGDAWRVSKEAGEGWQKPEFNDSKWVAAKVVAAMGAGPWGQVPAGDARAWVMHTASPIFRKAFTLKAAPARATVNICGLGYYELHLNGQKVGDRVLDPLFTRYDRRVLYPTYDVTSQLAAGKNALGVMLGNGFYNSQSRDAWNFDKTPWRDQPTLRAQLRLEYADGTTETFPTDATWKASTGPVRHDGTRNGEDYDARREIPGWDTATFDDSAWAAPTIVDGPKGKLCAETSEPIRVMQTITPVAIAAPRPGVYVFDLGQNIAGWAQLKVSGPAGTRITLRYGERLSADGTVDQRSIAEHVYTGPFQTDTYTLKGGGEETWEPRFTYHGFRWVEVTGWPGKPTVDNLRGRVVHTAFAPAGTFECSSDLLNQIQQMTLWSYRGNFVGIPTDCPHREKNGWTGDAHLAAEQAMFNWQNVAAYESWMDDLQDAQLDSGMLPGIVPTGGWGYQWGNGPAWDSAYVLIPWYLYQYDGDLRILEKHYDHLKRYVEYLRGVAKTGPGGEGVVNIGLGDWLPADTETAVAVTSTGYYYADALILSKMAALLGKTDDAKTYAELAGSIRAAFRKAFLKPDGAVDNASQTAQSCALYQGLVDASEQAAVFAQLVKQVEARDYHLDTGILGAKYLLRTLSNHGRADLALRIAEQTTPPSYGAWLKRDATTLWEDWGDGASRNHVMFGDISAWFYQYLAGINADPQKPAFKHIVLRPMPVGDLKWVKATHDSLYGTIASKWTRNGQTFRWQIVIPPNTTATVYVPASAGTKITEGGQPAEKAPGVKFIRQAEGAAIYEVESGSYAFESPVAE